MGHCLDRSTGPGAQINAGVEKKAVTAVTLFKLLKRRISQNAADQIVEEGEERRIKKKSCNAVNWHAEGFSSFLKKSFAKLGWGLSV